MKHYHFFKKKYFADRFTKAMQIL